MRELTREQQLYVEKETVKKRRASIIKPLNYQIAENLFLVNFEGRINRTPGLFSNNDLGTVVTTDYDQVVAELKKHIEDLDSMIASEHINDLQAFLDNKKIQYILLKREESLKAARQSQSATTGPNQTVQLLKREESLQAARQSQSATTSSNHTVQPPVVQSVTPERTGSDQTRFDNKAILVLTGDRSYEFRDQFRGNKNLISIRAGLGSGARVLTIAPDRLLENFETEYRAVQKERSLLTRFVSFFLRDALSEAADPRPWYQRIFSTTPEKTRSEKMKSLLLHANSDPKSNTAKALTRILDRTVAIHEKQESLNESVALAAIQQQNTRDNDNDLLVQLDTSADTTSSSTPRNVAAAVANREVKSPSSNRSPTPVLDADDVASTTLSASPQQNDSPRRSLSSSSLGDSSFPSPSSEGTSPNNSARGLGNTSSSASPASTLPSSRSSSTTAVVQRGFLSSLTGASRPSVVDVVAKRAEACGKLLSALERAFKPMWDSVNTNNALNPAKAYVEATNYGVTKVTYMLDFKDGKINQLIPFVREDEKVREQYRWIECIRALYTKFGAVRDSLGANHQDDVRLKMDDLLNIVNQLVQKGVLNELISPSIAKAYGEYVSEVNELEAHNASSTLGR